MISDPRRASTSGASAPIPHVILCCVRCEHWNRIGEQCPDQALAGRKYCSYHSQILEDHDPDRGSDTSSGSRSSHHPLIYRLAAIALLLIFLYAVFQTLLRG